MKAAVSRLDFAPKRDEMEVVDIRTGRFVFRPRAGAPVSFARLDKAITDAGYEIEAARLTVTGKLVSESRLRSRGSDQSFELVADDRREEVLEELEDLLEESEPDAIVTVSGAWATTGEGVETVRLESWEAASASGTR